MTQEAAELIHAKGFLQDPARLSWEEKFDRFRRLTELNSRSTVNMLHVSLNFDPSEFLTKTQLSAIADRYMEGLGMAAQPYLVYQHRDAAHPHLHIVSTLIQPDGKRIGSHNMHSRLSEPTRKAIEKEFDLVPGRRKKEALSLVQKIPASTQKLVYDGSNPLTESMERVLKTVLQHYHFTSLIEYNAILRSYNMTAETGGPNSKTMRHHGLRYRALDGSGKKVGPAIKASYFESKPTLRHLEKLFLQNRQIHAEHIPDLRQKLDWELFGNPASLDEFSEDLRKKSVELDLRTDAKDHPAKLVFVDHELKLAADANALGPAYHPDRLEMKFAEQQALEQQLSLGQQQQIHHGHRPSR